MRASISSYSLSHKYPYRSIDELLSFPAKVKAMGCEAIEFVLPFPLTQADVSAAPALRKACDEAGVACVAVCAGADFLANSVAQEAERLRRYVEVAAALGAPVMRHDATQGPTADMTNKSFEAALPRLADGCRQVTAFAETLGVKTCVENHGYFVQDSARVTALHEAIAHPNFGLLVDIGNFLCADEAPELAVAAAARYAVHAHVKDFHYQSGRQENPGTGWFPTRAGNWLRGAILGHGVVPLRQCVQLLAKAGYDGPLSIEFEGLEDVDLALPDALANLNKVL